MHVDRARVGNLLGAVSLAVSDLTLTGAARTAGVSSTAASALVTLSVRPGLSVTDLGRRVGLSQPAAARMVEGLESAGLAERRRGRRRGVAVHLTSAGLEVAGRVLGTREESLGELVDALDPSQQGQLSELLTVLLGGLYGRIGNAQYICRLCDRDSCQSDATCPIGDAEEADGGDTSTANRGRLIAGLVRESGVRRDRQPPSHSHE
ncbi:MarR family winged helix-turn-helix transcriptional regulator [Georgenia alba]|uniref:MarR family winged helix-turn-helix transcriptional regulator n=1 Tax=Georgenia alba TaxID=2233858 RepID=A0ABW2Q321_9MICO